MKIKMFYQSLVSDWNHGNAHFLRGIVKELQRRGESVEVYEPEDGWCLQQLIKNKGGKSIVGFHEYYPDLASFSAATGIDVNGVVLDKSDYSEIIFPDLEAESPSVSAIIPAISSGVSSLNETVSLQSFRFSPITILSSYTLLSVSTTVARE